MPARDIRTRLSIEGEKELKRELAAAAREMRVLESGLKATAAGFAAADDDMGGLEATSKSLRAQLEQQEKIVKGLMQAVRDSADVYGDASEETDGWTIRLNNALTKQEKLRKAIMDSDREMEELARDSVRAGRQLENGLGDSAEDTARSLRDMYDEMKGSIDDIRGSVGFSALTDAWEFGSGIVTGLDSFAEGTRDYRRQMAFLKENIKAAGLDYDEVMEQFYEITGVTGDTEGGVEGISNLVAAGFDIEEIAAAVDMLGGAVIRFPETLKFESLADGLQETLATRQATGQYGELLERLGVNIDDFNKALAEAETAEEAQQVMLSFLANHGLQETKKGFEGTNEGLTKATTASNKLNDALATLGGTIDTIMTPGKEFAADFVTNLNTGLTKGLGAVVGVSEEEYKAEIAAAGARGAIGGTGEWQTSADVLNIWEDLKTLFSSEGEAASQEATDAIQTELTANTPAVESAFYSAGENAMLQLGDGLASGAAVALAQLQSYMMAMADMASMIGVPVQYAAGGYGNSVMEGLQMGQAAINLDGKRVGTAIFPTINTMMGGGVTNRYDVRQ